MKGSGDLPTFQPPTGAVAATPLCAPKIRPDGFGLSQPAPSPTAQDGPYLPPVPAADRDGNVHDFSDSALLAGAPSVDLVGQGQFDSVLQAAHLGIVNSPQTWQAVLQFLSQPPHEH